MVDGLRMDGLVRVVGTCGYVRNEVFFTWGWFILLFSIFYFTIVAGFGIYREY